jgi:Site-specific recombinase XerD
MAIPKKYTKKDGSTAWMFTVYLGIDKYTGKEIRTTRRGFITQKMAKIEMNNLLANRESLSTTKQKRLLFQDVSSLWLEQYKRTVKDSTLINTNVFLNKYILPCFKNKYIDKIDMFYCQRQVNYWADALVNYSTLISYTRDIFDLAIKMNLITENPMNKIKRPKRLQEPTNKSENFYTKDELIQFLDCVCESYDFRYYALFRLLSFSGMRCGEAFALYWSDIDFCDNTISITKTVARKAQGGVTLQTPKTNTSIRQIDMDKNTMDILLQWKNEQATFFECNNLELNKDSKQLLFTNLSGGIVFSNSIAATITHITKKLKLKTITTHGLRHTHCSLLFEAGATPKEVQARLGHKDINTTMNIYAHVTKDRKKQAAQIFASYMDI